eukprot:gene15858-14190_t
MVREHTKVNWFSDDYIDVKDVRMDGKQQLCMLMLSYWCSEPRFFAQKRVIDFRNCGLVDNDLPVVGAVMLQDALLRDGGWSDSAGQEQRSAVLKNWQWSLHPTVRSLGMGDAFLAGKFTRANPRARALRVGLELWCDGVRGERHVAALDLLTKLTPKCTSCAAAAEWVVSTKEVGDRVRLRGKSVNSDVLRDEEVGYVVSINQIKQEGKSGQLCEADELWAQLAAACRDDEAAARAAAVQAEGKGRAVLLGAAHAVSLEHRAQRAESSLASAAGEVHLRREESSFASAAGEVHLRREESSLASAAGEVHLRREESSLASAAGEVHLRREESSLASAAGEVHLRREESSLASAAGEVHLRREESSLASAAGEVHLRREESAELRRRADAGAA